MKKLIEVGGMLFSVNLELPAILTEPPTPPTLESVHVVNTEYAPVGPNLVGWLAPLGLEVLPGRHVGILNIIAGAFMEEVKNGH